MKSTDYSEKVLDHFRNPRNVGSLKGEEVASGRVGNPVCGDIMEMYIEVNPNDETITDIKFQTFGCGSAVATSSMITEMAIGKTLDEAEKITRKDVADELEGLPPIKMHCSNLAADALRAAIKNYRTKYQIQNIQEKSQPETKIDIDNPKSLNKGQTTVIENEIKFLGNGVHYSVPNPEVFKDRRVLVVYKGRETLDTALEIIKHTKRVILLTEDLAIKFNDFELKKRIKTSNVKILGESRLLKILGEEDVEKVEILDLDEQHSYELFVDDVILLEHVQVPTSCDMPE